jgi:cation diffusion facilitator CzcD-associated flavoprotein CzcO/predicted ATP-grasp superfamily ATP-dependent carboligase
VDSVLVSDAETRGVVAACRGLAADGFRVTAAAGSPWAVSHWSRSCHRRLRMPHPVGDEDRFVAELERVLTEDRHAVLLPGSDASLLAISGHRERLEPHVRLGLPRHDVVLRALDKLLLGDAASSIGLPAPDVAVCWDVADAMGAVERLGLPVILKAVQSVFMVNGRARRSGSVRVERQDSLPALIPEYGKPCLLQRSEPGAVLSFAGVMAEGSLLAVALSRYERTWYPEAGNACFSRAVDPPAALRERVEALMADLEWEGIFELELIERPDGSWAAIDLNPRVYGSMALAVAAGANLPAVWCRHVLGQSPAPAVARAGIRYRWEDADLRHLLRQASRGRLRDSAAVLRPRRRVTHAHFSLKDPGPLAARVLYLAGVARRRGVGAPHVTTEHDVRDPARAPGRRKGNPDPVAVIGAGPYGLAASSHLRHAGVPVRTFGEALEFWRTQMPEGMILRSRKRSSHIADPERALTIDHFQAAEGRQVRTPSLLLEEFVDYGLWYQRQAVPDLDTRKVERVERQHGAFHLELGDGSELMADRVVVAAGLAPFGYRPEPFASLPTAVASHSSDHRDLGGFAGRRVLVVGGGQSALESAALLAERGADVQIVARTPGIYWLPDGGPPVKRPLRSYLPKPPTDVGGFSTGWAAATPDLFRRLPRPVQPVVSYRCIKPAGSGWLRPRLENVSMELAATAMEAEASNGQVRVGLSDGSERVVDHVLLGTGFRIDVGRYPFLAPELADEIETVEGYPKLRPGLETSVPGLHIVGAPAAFTFGPIMRFVVGTWYAAPSLTRNIRGRRQKPLSFSF